MVAEVVAVTCKMGNEVMHYVNGYSMVACSLMMTYTLQLQLLDIHNAWTFFHHLRMKNPITVVSTILVLVAPLMLPLMLTKQ